MTRRGISSGSFFIISDELMTFIFQLLPSKGSRTSPNCWWKVPQTELALWRVPQAVTEVAMNTIGMNQVG